MTTAQSRCRSRQEIRNSGSETLKSGRRFLRLMNSTVCFKFHARCASSKIATCSIGGRLASTRHSSRKWWMFWMNARTSLWATPFRTAMPRSRDCRILSRAKASCRTATSGPLPDRKTLYSSSLLSMCFVAASRPTSVFPAPGTPVTKQIVFSWRAFVVSIISATVLAVTLRFVAPASVREISVTECPR